MNFKLKKSGFTLSEVMITLTLIGALATLTLSTIGASVQQRARLAEFSLTEEVSMLVIMEQSLLMILMNKG